MDRSRLFLLLLLLLTRQFIVTELGKAQNFLFLLQKMIKIFVDLSSDLIFSSFIYKQPQEILTELPHDCFTKSLKTFSIFLPLSLFYPPMIWIFHLSQTWYPMTIYKNKTTKQNTHTQNRFWRATVQYRAHS